MVLITIIFTHYLIYVSIYLSLVLTEDVNSILFNSIFRAYLVHNT